MIKMQKMSSVVLAFLAISFSSFSQDKTSSFSSLLLKYYDLKNALVKSDVQATIKAAGDLSLVIKTVDEKKLAPNELSAFLSLKPKMLAGAGTITAGKGLEKQRLAFQSISGYMITLAKTGKPAKPAFVAYCPMKKAYWLSEEQAIKNPYYGYAMLTCGNVTDTIK